MKCETAFLQNELELNDFISVLMAEGVRSYLEIGSKFGGSLWKVARSLPKKSRVVSVDLPHGDKSFKESQAPLEECVRALKAKGYDAHLILGDSTAADVVEKARALGPYDAVFIDANHTLPYVRKDWENYGPMGKLVAFHDIGFYRREGLPPGKKPIEVPIFWRELKALGKNRTLDIRRDKQDNGIGVVWC